MPAGTSRKREPVSRTTQLRFRVVRNTLRRRESVRHAPRSDRGTVLREAGAAAPLHPGFPHPAGRLDRVREDAGQTGRAAPDTSQRLRRGPAGAGVARTAGDRCQDRRRAARAGRTRPGRSSARALQRVGGAGVAVVPRAGARRHAADRLVEAGRHPDRRRLAVRVAARVRRGARRIGRAAARGWRGRPAAAEEADQDRRLHRARSPGTADVAGAAGRAEPVAGRNRRVRERVRRASSRGARRRRRALEHQRQPGSQHQRLAIAPHREGRCRGTALRSGDRGHPLGGARHRDRCDAQGVPAPRRETTDPRTGSRQRTTTS